jgi:glutamate-1-semialdehyde 2,1-aminomutase
MPLSTATLERFTVREHSAQLFAEAQTLMPGGVNSPVRAFGSVGGGTPVVVKRAEGAYLYDEDGLSYIDMIGGWGPAILGHANPQVVAAVQEAAKAGMGFGCPTAVENELAKMVLAAVPSMEMLRFVNSGTEAAMSAIRLARAHTGRSRIIKFSGCYHGHADFLLVSAGSGVATFGLPNSSGVTAENVKDTLTADFNRLESVEALFKVHGDKIAAVVVEPIAGNMGCIPPEAGFLEGLRRLCDEHGAMLVFDEVMTGFRVAYGGAQQRYGVKPDITVLGKIVGGGMPVGAYGASKAIMSVVAPLGSMYQAGTLSGHPLGMAAGLATLRQLQAPEVYPQLEAQTKALVDGLRQQCQALELPHTLTQVGAMFSLFFNAGPIQAYEDVQKGHKGAFLAFFWEALRQGVYWPPSAYEACFTSLCHTPEVVEELLQRLKPALQAAKQAM